MKLKMKTWFRREMPSKEEFNFSQNPTCVGKLIPFRRPKAVATQGVLVRMVNECIALGATEVFVGNPDSKSFQFVAGANTYAGTLPTEAVTNIKELISFKSPIYLDWSEVSAEDLRLGVSTNGNVPIYCFSWKLKKELQRQETYMDLVQEELPSTPCLILIVDDDLRFSQILSRILEEQGFQTLTASNGKEGLAILEDFKPQLIITDVHMPHLSGPEFLLEGRKIGIEAPYLVLTNDEDALTEAELILLGASAFVKKSEDPRVLLAWCRRLTGLRRVS